MFLLRELRERSFDLRVAGMLLEEVGQNLASGGIVAFDCEESGEVEIGLLECGRDADGLLEARFRVGWLVFAEVEDAEIV